MSSRFYAATVINKRLLVNKLFIGVTGNIDVEWKQEAINFRFFPEVFNSYLATTDVVLDYYSHNYELEDIIRDISKKIQCTKNEVFH